MVGNILHYDEIPEVETAIEGFNIIIKEALAIFQQQFTEDGHTISVGNISGRRSERELEYSFRRIGKAAELCSGNCFKETIPDAV